MLLTVEDELAEFFWRLHLVALYACQVAMVVFVELRMYYEKGFDFLKCEILKISLFCLLVIFLEKKKKKEKTQKNP